MLFTRVKQLLRCYRILENGCGSLKRNLRTECPSRVIINDELIRRQVTGICRYSSDQTRNLDFGWDVGKTTGHIVRMRGLPFTANEQDVMDFFSPINPIDISLFRNRAGGAEVKFGSHEDAARAMRKDRAYMRNRYIELFIDSTPEGNETGNNSDSEQDTGRNIGHRVSMQELPFDQNIAKSTAHIVHMRGLPYTAVEQDVMDFFCPINPINVDLFRNRDGGAKVEFGSREEAVRAMSKDKSYMQHRYIDLFLMSAAKGNEFGNNFEQDSQEDDIVHRISVQGLPFSANKQDVIDFFSPLNPIDVDIKYRGGRATGKAHVTFQSSEDVDKAMLKNRSFMESYRIRLSRNSKLEVDESEGESSGDGISVNVAEKGFRNSTRYRVYMRGLPYIANQQDILDFFSPLNPINVDIKYWEDRPTGRADVEFESYEDAVKAMGKNKAYMRNRYIELSCKFLEEEHNSEGKLVNLDSLYDK